jgi:hypothetical protein
VLNAVKKVRLIISYAFITRVEIDFPLIFIG